MKFLILFTCIALTQANVFKPKNLEELTKRFPKFAPKIVGGDEAAIIQRPFQAAILADNGVFCGGVIIGPKTILTAASCVDGATNFEVTIGVGSLNYATPIETTKFLVHTAWDAWYKTDNLALVYLPEALKYSESIQNIKLYEKSKSLESVNGTVSGWGKVSDSSTAHSEVLRSATDTIISNTDCKKFFSDQVIKDTNLCLNGEDGKGVCNGDIGGPLTVKEGGATLLAGIASFVSPWGCTIGYPSVYTRVSSYVTWIKQNIEEKQIY